MFLPQRMALNAVSGWAQLGVRMTLADVLMAYANGKRDFRGIVLEIESGFECDLRGADFSDGQLTGSYFSYANLQRAKFVRTQLQRAELSNARLQATDLDGADLSEANLAYANLRGASLRGASLRGANLHGVHLERADLTGADLSHALLTRAMLQGAILQEAQLSGCNCFRAQGLDLVGALCDRTTTYPDGHRDNV